MTMNGHQFSYSSAPLKRVKYVQFGILSPEEIVCYISDEYVRFFLLLSFIKIFFYLFLIETNVGCLN
jgi:hypothetical protein